MTTDLYAIALCFSSLALIYVVCELFELCKKIDKELEDVS